MRRDWRHEEMGGASVTAKRKQRKAQPQWDSSRWWGWKPQHTPATGGCSLAYQLCVVVPLLMCFCVSLVQLSRDAAGQSQHVRTSAGANLGKALSSTGRCPGLEPCNPSSITAPMKEQNEGEKNII